MEEKNVNIPERYKPLSMWAYVGYNLLFAIPLVGFIFMIIYSINSEDRNINLRNYARSFLVVYAIACVLAILMVILGVSIFASAAKVVGSM